MKEKLDLKDLKKILNNINSTIQENKLYLSKLDSVIGDGDHGTTIAKGFLAIMDEIKSKESSSISDLLQTSGKTLIATIGGVSGPIFGTFFIEMGKAISSDKESVDLNDLYRMFSNSLNKVMILGGAKPGDKTMIDALHPAVKKLEESVNKKLSLKDSFKDMSIAAKIGAESTKDLVAIKGRARYLKDRSIGFEDAGANTIYLIINAIYKTL